MRHSTHVSRPNNRKRERQRTLHVSDENADDRSEDEVLKQRRDERERHTEHGQQQVGDAQVQQQYVGQCPHPAILRNGERHQRVSGHRQDEDGDVQTDAQLHLDTSSASDWKSSVRLRLILPRRVVHVRHSSSAESYPVNCKQHV